MDLGGRPNASAVARVFAVIVLANSLGKAVADSADLMQRLAELARVDGLTSLPNRRAAAA